MASRSGSYRRSRRSSPPPNVASGSRSRNQENLERRHQDTRGRSRSRSPRHDRWASNPPGGRHASSRSGRSRMRSPTPSRMSRQRSSNYQHENRHGRGQGRRENRDIQSRSPDGRRRRGERESESTWRTRARSSPPAEARWTRRTSRSLSPQGRRTRRGHLVGQGGGMGYAHVGRRSQSSDASMRSVSPPFPQRDDERGSIGRGEWRGVQDGESSRVVGRRRIENVSESTWRTRARNSPPAETTRKRGAARSLIPQGYRSRQGDPGWQERGEQGEGMSYSGVGRRSQSSDASMRSITPPFSQWGDEHRPMGREGWGDKQDHRSRDRDASQAGDSSCHHQVKTQIPQSNTPPMPGRGHA
ncbi:hypothetical protein BKA70DRAFT_1560654, partial [Coprinopsis sp. MPI-PUGE-AT-0042]